jgi:hypothetical protein
MSNGNTLHEQMFDYGAGCKIVGIEIAGIEIDSSVTPESYRVRSR